MKNTFGCIFKLSHGSCPYSHYLILWCVSTSFVKKAWCDRHRCVEKLRECSSLLKKTHEMKEDLKRNIREQRLNKRVVIG